MSVNFPIDKGVKISSDSIDFTTSSKLETLIVSPGWTSVVNFVLVPMIFPEPSHVINPVPLDE